MKYNRIGVIRKFWKIIFLIIAFICGSQKYGGSFLKDDVSFTYPSGWSITKQKKLDDIGYFISVEKAGFNASGLLMITWINRILDTFEYLNTIQEEYEISIKEIVFYTNTNENNFLCAIPYDNLKNNYSHMKIKDY